MRTLRFWSDEGLVPADRNGAGHRVYGPAAVARLDLVRTLRELGLGLDDVRAVLSRRRGVGEIAAAHVRALDDRIRELRAQRAVCALLARTGAGDTPPDERSVTLMNDLARLSAAQRQHLIAAQNEGAGVLLRHAARLILRQRVRHVARRGTFGRQ